MAYVTDSLNLAVPELRPSQLHSGWKISNLRYRHHWEDFTEAQAPTLTGEEEQREKSLTAFSKIKVTLTCTRYVCNDVHNQLQNISITLK